MVPPLTALYLYPYGYNSAKEGSFPGLIPRGGFAKPACDRCRCGRRGRGAVKRAAARPSSCSRSVSTAFVKLSMVLSASPCSMPSRTQCLIWPSEHHLPAPVQRRFRGVDLGEHILAGHVLVHHAVDGLHLADYFLEPAMQVVGIHALPHDAPSARDAHCFVQGPILGENRIGRTAGPSKAVVFGDCSEVAHI